MGADPITAAVVGGALGLISSDGDIGAAVTGALTGGIGGAAFGPLAGTIGEAVGSAALGNALAGAAIGGIGSAVNGGDPLTGAVLGGAFGGFSGGESGVTDLAGNSFGSYSGNLGDVATVTPVNMGAYEGITNLGSAPLDSFGNWYAPVEDAFATSTQAFGPPNVQPGSLWEDISSTGGALNRLAQAGKQTALGQGLDIAGKGYGLYNILESNGKQQELYNKQKQAMDAQLAAYQSGGNQQGNNFSPLQSFGRNNWTAVRG